MALFEVPGWKINDKPVPGPSHSSKKRKHYSGGADVNEKLDVASVNVEKLIAKLGNPNTANDGPARKRRKSKGSKAEYTVGQTSEVSKPGNPEKKPASPKKRDGETGKGNKVEGLPSSGKSLKKKGKQKAVESSQTSAPVQKSQKSSKASEGLTALQSGMKHSLDGARFRWINETLYKSDSSHAQQMMRENPDMFSEYHVGFRHQVHSWPSNPVTHYISTLSKYPSRTVVADLGCGDAALARALIPKNLIVLSYDLVSQNEYVVEADICEKLPLPGSATTSPSGDDDGSCAQVVDVVVCALSLMGTNWPNCIREAWRVLRPGGELKIAEVQSRFTDVEAFASLISSVGFKLRSTDSENTHFTLFEFTKVQRKPKSDKEWSNIMSRGDLLKPCEYKRR